MLQDEHNDLLHLLTLIESLEKVLVFSREANDAESFFKLNDQMNFNAVLNLLGHVGETGEKLSQGFLQATSAINWRKIKGFRNRIAHDYLGLDTLKVFQIVSEEVPPLLNELYVNTQKRLTAGILSREELQAATESDYYSKVQFSRLTRPIS
jgi:uncharacterized protein with HEPN domain